MKTLAAVYKITHEYREKVFILLLSVVVFAGFTYVFLLQKAILNVVEREKVTKNLTLVSTDVNDLESKYFTLKNSVTLEMAHAKGLKDAEVTAYISKRPQTAMAPHNEL